jgi:hypothetical protein
MHIVIAPRTPLLSCTSVDLVIPLCLALQAWVSHTSDPVLSPKCYMLLPLHNSIQDTTPLCLALQAWVSHAAEPLISPIATT